jgi:hypothetical protein
VGVVGAGGTRGGRTKLDPRFPVAGNFAGKFFKYPADAAVPGVNLWLNSSALHENPRFSSRSGQGILFRRRREFFRAGREFIRRSRDAMPPARVMKTIYKIARKGLDPCPAGQRHPSNQPDTHFRRFDDDASLIAH